MMIYSNPLYPNQKIQTQQYFEEEDIPRIPDFRFKMNYVISYPDLFIACNHFI